MTCNIPTAVAPTHSALQRQNLVASLAGPLSSLHAVLPAVLGHKPRAAAAQQRQLGRHLLPAGVHTVLMSAVACAGKDGRDLVMIYCHIATAWTPACTQPEAPPAAAGTLFVAVLATRDQQPKPAHTLVATPSLSDCQKTSYCRTSSASSRSSRSCTIFSCWISGTCTRMRSRTAARSTVPTGGCTGCGRATCCCSCRLRVCSLLLTCQLHVRLCRLHRLRLRHLVLRHLVLRRLLC